MSNMLQSDTLKTLVGVYGSLREGLGNHRLLQEAEFVGTDNLPAEYGMVSLGGFPGVFKGGSTSIVLELYLVDANELIRLDQLEGNGSFYTREEVATLAGASPWVYLLPKERYKDQEPVPSGDWKTYLEAQPSRWRY
tara:strand:- start:472 stop:882 length:411 start_codon:yes stop_codon:yes gene_type:complete